MFDRIRDTFRSLLHKKEKFEQRDDLPCDERRTRRPRLSCAAAAAAANGTKERLVVHGSGYDDLATAMQPLTSLPVSADSVARAAAAVAILPVQSMVEETHRQRRILQTQEEPTLLLGPDRRLPRIPPFVHRDLNRPVARLEPGAVVAAGSVEALARLTDLSSTGCDDGGDGDDDDGNDPFAQRENTGGPAATGVSRARSQQPSLGPLRVRVPINTTLEGPSATGGGGLPPSPPPCGGGGGRVGPSPSTLLWHQQHADAAAGLLDFGWEVVEPPTNESLRRLMDFQRAQLQAQRQRSGGVFGHGRNGYDDNDNDALRDDDLLMQQYHAAPFEAVPSVARFSKRSLAARSLREAGGLRGFGSPSPLRPELTPARGRTEKLQGAARAATKVAQGLAPNPLDTSRVDFRREYSSRSGPLLPVSSAAASDRPPNHSQRNHYYEQLHQRKPTVSFGGPSVARSAVVSGGGGLSCGGADAPLGMKRPVPPWEVDADL